MTGLLQRALRKIGGGGLDYETAKSLSASPSSAKRLKAAQQTEEQPEILYYLAHDPAPEVRAAVAANDATPLQADAILAHDRDEAVRSDLAVKISRLVPGIGAAESDRIRRLTHEVLETLVRDNVPRVRQIIAEALKDVANVPPEIVQQLARDSEIKVAEPVLQFSPVLTDADLLEIIANTPIPGALGAIAKRKGLGETISDAIGASGDVDALTALLSNKTAQIREAVLDRLVDRAVDHTAWHEPLVTRPRLSAAAIGKLASFVATSLLATLRERPDVDPETARKVSETVMRRLAPEPAQSPAAADNGSEHAKRLHEAGKLDDVAFRQAVLGGDKAFVRNGLSILSGLPTAAVDKVLGAQSGRGVVALCWKAGLSMDTAVRLQRQICRVATVAVILPRPDGAWPLSPETMNWQLDFIASLEA